MGTAGPVSPRPDTSGLSEAWVRGIPHDPLEPAWSVYDSDIAATVKIYNDYLARQKGFGSLNPMLTKAMCWTETGAGSTKWKSRPMQIGNSGDAGLFELLKTSPKNKLMLPPVFYKGGSLELTSSNVRTIPVYNIRAGVGYLLLRACTYKATPQLLDQGRFFSDVVQRNDNFARIALRDQTTIDELRLQNPSVRPIALKPWTTIKFHHFAQYSELSFVPINPLQAAVTYNNADVVSYVKKIEYCLWVLQGGASAADAQ